MANKVALIKASIWDDPAFLALSSPAQRLYVLLLGQDDIDLCGALAIRVARWADLAPDTRARPQIIAKALVELERARFVLTDRRTEEALIRTYPRHAGSLKVPNVIVGMSRHYAKIRSRTLRATVVDELPANALDIVRGAVRELLAEPFLSDFTKAKGQPNTPTPGGKGFPEHDPHKDPSTAFPPDRLSACPPLPVDLPVPPTGVAAAGSGNVSDIMRRIAEQRAAGAAS